MCQCAAPPSVMFAVDLRINSRFFYIYICRVITASVAVASPSPEHSEKCVVILAVGIQ